LQRFGSASQPVQKCRRLAYWMRRFSFTNPFLPAEMPDDPLERAKILLARIGGKNAAIQVLQDEDDKRLMLAMTPGQKRIVEDMTADTAGTLQISGPHLTWFEQEQHEYHVLSYYDEDAQAVLGTCLSDTGPPHLAQQTLRCTCLAAAAVGQRLRRALANTQPRNPRGPTCFARIDVQGQANASTVCLTIWTTRTQPSGRRVYQQSSTPSRLPARTLKKARCSDIWPNHICAPAAQPPVLSERTVVHAAR